MRKRLTIPVLIAMVLLASACGNSDDSATGMPDTSPDHSVSGGMHGSEDDEYGFGSPADAVDADRVIEIEATDELTFTPTSVDVSAGEVITFRIHNSGTVTHDFTLGDEDMQREHGEAMQEGSMTHSAGNAVTIEAGETVELTWKFQEAQGILYGCHEAGHYEAGMLGQINIEV